MLYLDNAATTGVRREALEAMWPYLTGTFGNPSSPHAFGRAAAEGLKGARQTIAKVLGKRATQITFTAGGTEADNLAIKGIALANPRGRHIISTPLEHKAVLESLDYLRRFHGFEISMLTPDRYGQVSAEELKQLSREDTTLVSVHYANNEIGTIQPIAELAQATSAPFHVDAVQAAHLPLDLDVSAISLSGHKVGAPKGIGALWSKAPLEPVIHGGGQEKGRRSGTENVAGAVAFATALELAREELFPDLSGFITSALEIEGAQLSGHPTMRLPGHASFVFEGTGAETVLLELERLGVICSPGSACGQGEVSHVLLGLGYSEDLARTSVRFTFSASHTPEDVDFAAQALKSAVATVRSSFSPH
ncbi:cysteine desulfurase family protein [Corynebacterium callunae]|uniref:Cysteine sulfinate desulfinase n=1 Tax=Corynebacterium callunae DSM 20147 TaxID=1121353 RepID=M1UTG7_9CORY|nr:cysteine desulfurase family protein [Corynebacterium callunae]AGG66447.1 cysteine sulfinate desulfinase [Corynebacterium callunae DSM 20147]